MKTHVHTKLAHVVHSNIIYDRQNLQITENISNIRKDKQIVAYSFNGILLTNKKEWTTNTCNDMDISEKIVELKKSDFNSTNSIYIIVLAI